jgi:hypothetical protein
MRLDTSGDTSSPRAYNVTSFRTALVVRQRELDRLIDASRPRRQRRLELVRPIRRQDEHDIGVLAQTVHLVEQPVQQRFLHRPVHVRALARDEIDVLDDHHRGLEKSREPEVFADEPDLLGRDEQRCVNPAAATRDSESYASCRCPAVRRTAVPYGTTTAAP